MVEEVVAIEPKTDAIEIKARATGNIDEMQKRLSKLQLFSISRYSSGLRLLRVESRDMQKRPFLFMIIDMGQDRLRIDYTIALDSSSKLRRLSVLKTAIGVLSLVSDIYGIDTTEMFQHLDSAIDEVLGSITQSYSALFNNYDSISNEFKELKRLNIELEASNKNLTVTAMQLSDENKELKAHLKELETYSESSLMVMLQDWIESHDGTIDVNEFSKSYKMNPTRTEQVLNHMVSLGYIELRG